MHRDHGWGMREMSSELPSMSFQEVRCPCNRAFSGLMKEDRDKSPAEDEHDIPPTQRPVVQTATVGDKTPESSFLLDSRMLTK